MIDLMTAKQVRKLRSVQGECSIANKWPSQTGRQNTDDLVQKVYIHWLKRSV